LRLDQLPDDPAVLVRMVIALEAENEKLRGVLAVFRAIIFGAKSKRSTS
jgi:hypothetical protein